MSFNMIAGAYSKYILRAFLSERSIVSQSRDTNGNMVHQTTNVNIVTLVDEGKTRMTDHIISSITSSFTN